MNGTQKLHELGQSIWLDQINRELLDSGTLARYVADYSVTGLTSNPTIFAAAIGKSEHYDAAIAALVGNGKSHEDLFFELALEDLRRAADLFRPAHDSTRGVDGWASLEVSPLLAADTANTVAASKNLYARAARPNLFIKIPGTPEGVPAIEEAIYSGVPINITLLFSRKHYLAAVGAYLRGIERRIAEGLNPVVHSVASLFISRWDVAVQLKVPEPLRNQLGCAVAGQCYCAYRDVLASPRWQKLASAGAVPQRLLWASTGAKDPALPETYYVEALAAPDTVDTMPEKTLLAFAEHGEPGDIMRTDGGHAETILENFRREGIDDDALGTQLQVEGTAAFAKSWNELMQGIAQKIEVLGVHHA